MSNITVSISDQGGIDVLIAGCRGEFLALTEMSCNMPKLTEGRFKLETNIMNQTQLMQAVIDIAVAAGASILEVYAQADAPAVALKADDSPITEADQRAHTLITERLAALSPDLPILSEESAAVAFATRKTWTSYWLVDPLDGTKEFIKRNGEFTVNIAHIENGQAVMGVVHVPVTGTTYSGSLGTGAFVQRRNGKLQPIHAALMQAGSTRVRVVASRSHGDAALQRVLHHIQSRFAEVDVVSMGSSLKLCLLAEGTADIYPRLAPTSEWDTAAAHAILAAAGGDIVTTGFEPLRYNTRESLLNPDFLALADTAYDWPAALRGCL